MLTKSWSETDMPCALLVRFVCFDHAPLCSISSVSYLCNISQQKCISIHIVMITLSLLVYLLIAIRSALSGTTIVWRAFSMNGASSGGVWIALGRGGVGV